MTAADRTIVRGCAACVVLALTALLLPRVIRVGEGFAASAGAALVLVGGLLVTTVCALALVAATARRHAVLTPWVRLCGYAPAVVLSSGLVALFWFLAY